MVGVGVGVDVTVTVDVVEPEVSALTVNGIKLATSNMSARIT